jgi:hypothetical protein
MNPSKFPHLMNAAAEFSVCCLCTIGEGVVKDVLEIIEVGRGMFLLRFTLDLSKDYHMLSSDVKNSLCKLARHGAQDATKIDEEVEYAGLYDKVHYDPKDKADVK